MHGGLPASYAPFSRFDVHMSDQYSSKPTVRSRWGKQRASFSAQPQYISVGQAVALLECRIHESGLTMNGATGMLGP